MYFPWNILIKTFSVFKWFAKMFFDLFNKLDWWYQNCISGWFSIDYFRFWNEPQTSFQTSVEIETITGRKIKFFIQDFFSKWDHNLVTFTEENLNRKLHFLCSRSCLLNRVRRWRGSLAQSSNTRTVQFFHQKSKNFVTCCITFLQIIFYCST